MLLKTCSPRPLHLTLVIQLRAVLTIPLRAVLPIRLRVALPIRPWVALPQGLFPRRLAARGRCA